jgi:hypothetical protein
MLWDGENVHEGMVIDIAVRRTDGPRPKTSELVPSRQLRTEPQKAARVREVRRWQIPSGDFLSATEARRGFGDLLRTIATSSSDVMSCELIFGELVANGLEHGKGDVTVTLWRVGCELVLAAKDKGGWSPGKPCGALPEPLSDRGRGLFFVDALGRLILEPAHASEVRVVLPATIGQVRRAPKLGY